MRLPAFLSIARPINRSHWTNAGSRETRFSHSIKLLLNDSDRERLDHAADVCGCRSTADFVRQAALHAALALELHDGTREDG